MMIWRLEVEDVACPVDVMDKMDVFTFLCSELERMKLWERKQGHRASFRVQVISEKHDKIWHFVRDDSTISRH